MLSRDACERFREGFEPRAGAPPEVDAHRAACPDCGLWAERLERAVAVAAASPLPVPPALAARLSAIGGGSIPCDDVLRLMPAALGRSDDPELEGEGGGFADPAAERHLAECERCRPLYGAIRAAATAPPRPLAASLRERLAAIATAVAQLRPPLPFWVRDGRVAVAAAYLLTAALSLVVGVGDAAALLRDTSNALSRPMRELAPARLRRPATEVLSAAWESGRDLVAEELEAARDRAGEWLEATADALIPEALEPYLEALRDPPNSELSSPEGDPE